MRILMLGNSFTFCNDLPSMLAELTGAEVLHHTRGGARLSEQLNPSTNMGKLTQDALAFEHWDYVILQEMSNGPITAKPSFLKSVSALADQARHAGATPLLFATWAYQKDSEKMSGMGISYEEMAEQMSATYHEAAEASGALIADVGQKFFERSETEILYADDGVHPNAAGSRLAAETIAAVIAEDQAGKIPDIVLEVEVNHKNDDRLRPLYLYSLLLRHTDEDHPLSTKQLQDMMLEEYGIHMHRTTVNSNVDILRAAGFDVMSRRSRSMLYYLDSRQFELPELKILIDAVESSKFITGGKSCALVDKLTSLTSRSNAEKLKRNLHVSGRAKSANEKGYYIVDAINQAINDGKRISFQYMDYDAKKKLVLRHGGAAYVVSPFTLIWNGDYYYLVAYDHAQNEVHHYRVDRIAKSPEILETAADPIPEDFDVARYSKEIFQMFGSGEAVEVKLICCNDAMNGLVDKFSLNFKTRKYDEKHFLATVKAYPSPTFYGWIFQWNGKIIIQGPNDVLEGYKAMLRKGLEVSAQ